MGRSSRSTPSTCSTSKKNTDSGWAPGSAALPPRLPNRDAVTWKRCGRPSGRSAIASRVGDQVGDRQRQRGVDDLGQPRGDVVEAAGEDRDVVAGAVDLHARAVELGLEHRGAAEAVECVGDAGRGLGEHRADGPAHLQGELLESGLRRRSARRPRRRAGRRRASPPGAPPPRGCRRPGRRRRPSRRPAHPAAARRRAAAAGTSARSRWPRRRDPRAVRRGAPAIPCPRRAPISLNAASTPRTVRVGSAAGVGQRPQRRPPDADLALRQLAGQPGHDDGDQPRRRRRRPRAAGRRCARSWPAGPRTRRPPRRHGRRLRAAPHHPGTSHRQHRTSAAELAFRQRKFERAPAGMPFRRGAQRTAKVTECQPVAPSGIGVGPLGGLACSRCCRWRAP